MSLRENMASFFRYFAEKNNLSMAKIQVKADISRNSLYAYIRGEGNPTIAMLEFIAGNLGVDPVLIVLGEYDPDSRLVCVLVLDTVRIVAQLPHEEQLRFMHLLTAEIMKLWDSQ